MKLKAITYKTVFPIAIGLCAILSGFWLLPDKPSTSLVSDLDYLGLAILHDCEDEYDIDISKLLTAPKQHVEVGEWLSETNPLTKKGYVLPKTIPPYACDKLSVVAFHNTKMEITPIGEVLTVQNPNNPKEAKAELRMYSDQEFAQSSGISLVEYVERMDWPKNRLGMRDVHK